MAIHSNRIHPCLDDLTCPQPTLTKSSVSGKVTWFSAKLDEEFHCLLTGVVCIEDSIVVCDNENKNVKRFRQTGQFVSSLTLEDPCGICPLLDNSKREFVVTEPDEHRIVFCELGESDIGVTSKIGTVKKYECIATLDEVKLVVGCCEIGSVSVDVIDYNGSVLKSIQRTDGTFKLFRNPAALTCHKDSGVILVSDPGRNVLVCITPKGKEIFTFDPNGRPSGLCVDAQGSIFMAQYDAHSVYRLSADGVKESVIVDGDCEVKTPLALSMNNGTLVLTEEMPSERILLIKMAALPSTDRQMTNVSLSNVHMWINTSPRNTQNKAGNK